jgi:ferrous iron transport protein A
MELVPVHQLRQGEFGEVSQVVGSPDHVRRLEELGFRSGVALEIVRSGTPCIVRIGGTKLCFRHDELVRVLVKPRKTA